MQNQIKIFRHEKRLLNKNKEKKLNRLTTFADVEVPIRVLLVHSPGTKHCSSFAELKPKRQIVKNIKL